MIHPFRAWFFDAVGTLIRPEPSAASVYAEVGRRHGSRRSEEVLSGRFRDAFHVEETVDQQAGWRTSENRETERWQRIVARALDDVRDPAAVFKELWDHFSRPGAWRCEPEAAEVLAEVERRGVVLGIASNFDSRLRSVLAGLPELRFLRHVIVSSEVGWRKPAPGFFDAVVRAGGCSPGEVLLIGDDLVNDHKGGSAAGLATVLYDPTDRHRDCPGMRVRRLGQLVNEACFPARDR